MLRRNYLLNILALILTLYGVILIFPSAVKAFKIIFEILLPFIFGFFIAYLLAPLINKLSKKINRKFIVFLVVILFVLSLSVILFTFIPNLINEINDLVEMVPKFLSNAEIFIEQFLNKMHLNMINSKDLIEKFKEFLYGRMNEVTSVLITVAQMTIKILFSSLISIVTAIYFLLDFENITQFIKMKIDKDRHFVIYSFFRELNIVLRAYFKGVFLVSLFLSIVTSIFFSVVKVPFAILLGIIIGITNIIPYVGPYIGGGLAVVLGLSISLKHGIIVLVGIIIIQFVESMLITPNIQGKSVNVHPILVLFSIVLFGELFGVLGMVFAIPILAFSQTLFKSLKLLENNGK